MEDPYLSWSSIYLDAQRFVYDSLLDLPAWFRRLSPGQVQDIARVMATWRKPHATVTREATQMEQNILPLEEIERQAILNAIKACHGNIHKAAAALRVGRTTVYRKLRSWGDGSLLMKASALNGIHSNLTTPDQPAK